MNGVSLTRIVLAGNTVFWMWFWIEVLRQSSPYIDHQLAFEEIVPVYRFGGSALPPNAEISLPSLKVLHTTQFPVLFVVARLVNVSGHGWDERIWSLSMGTWVLVLTILASYFQWWVFAVAVKRLVQLCGVVVRRG